MTVHLNRPDLSDPMAGTPLGLAYDGGCCNQIREVGLGWVLSTASGFVYLSYFRVPRAFTAANMAFYTAGTAAGATPTLVKYGLFSVAANGDLTRIAVTASNTALFAATNTRYPQALLAGVALTPGVTYASGLLLTTAAAVPILVAAITSNGAAAAGQPPRLSGTIAAQTDINASYTAASIANGAGRQLAEITT